MRIQLLSDGLVISLFLSRWKMGVGERLIWYVLSILSSFTTPLLRFPAFLALVHSTSTTAARSPAALLELGYLLAITLPRLAPARLS